MGVGRGSTVRLWGTAARRGRGCDVRLTLAHGTQMTDVGASGVVLFVGRKGVELATVEILDEQGDLLVSRAAS